MYTNLITSGVNEIELFVPNNLHNDLCKEVSVKIMNFLV